MSRHSSKIPDTGKIGKVESVTNVAPSANYRVEAPRACSMTCHEMDWIITSHSSRFATEAAEHIAGCEHCRRLAAVLDRCLPASPLSEHQVRHIELLMLRELTPVRPVEPERVLLAALALVILTVVGAGAFLLGANGWLSLGIGERLTVFLALSGCACALAGSLIRLIVPGSRHTISPARVSIGVLSLLALVFATLFAWRQESGFVSNGLGCLRVGFACTIPAAALTWLLLRRGAILSPGLTGAAKGGLAGLAGLMVLEIRCPNSNAVHILVWHLGVTLLTMASGLVIGAMVSVMPRRRCHTP
jgi:hypothetical protein